MKKTVLREYAKLIEEVDFPSPFNEEVTPIIRFSFSPVKLNIMFVRRRL